MFFFFFLVCAAVQQLHRIYKVSAAQPFAGDFRDERQRGHHQRPGGDAAAVGQYSPHTGTGLGGMRNFQQSQKNRHDLTKDKLKEIRQMKSA